MSRSVLLVRAPDPDRDAGAVVELTAQTFGRYAFVRQGAMSWYVLHSHYDWEASAIGVLGGQLVTHWGVWGYRMRVGRAEVRCAGIGAVATHMDHRRQGLMDRTAPHGLRRSRELGYPLSVLFAIDDYYDRFGYVTAWPTSRWVVRRADLPAELPRPRGLRPIPFAPNPALVRLHNRWNAGLTGTAVRPTYPGPVRPGGLNPDRKVEVFAWDDARGRLAGHALVREDGAALVCTEATGEPDAVLFALARLAARKGTPELRFESLPHGSALAGRLRTMNCRYEEQRFRNGGAMVRVLDLAACLRAMEGELSARLAASELADYRGRLAIHGPEESVGLALGGGRVQVQPRAGGRTSLRIGWELAQLLIGSDAPLEICERARARLSGDARRLVPVLFPAQHPELHLADRF